MIVVLKIIILLLAIGLIFIAKSIYKDFSSVKKTDGFDNISIWEKIKFNLTFYSILIALVSLFTFFIYFLFVHLQII